ncbi:MAG: hypothetical protein AAGE96_20540 [Cyanobacteria bacterium P01_G01_bin.19]
MTSLYWMSIMETIIQVVLPHSHQDAIARIYLEGKVLELFALNGIYSELWRVQSGVKSTL